MPKQKTKITRQSMMQFTDQFFPARPRILLKKAHKKTIKQLGKAVKLGPATSRNKSYVSWLYRISMLHNADELSKKYSGSAQMWRNPYARPQPRKAIKQASVWYTSYPISLITRRKESIIKGLADESLWRVFNEIGIDALHTGPMKISGGIDGWKETPSIDGHFDRISNKLDPQFGDKEEFKNLTEVAGRYGGIVIDDIVPGHTGKGPDFWLATMAYGAYPGIYHMVEIAQDDWNLLPEVPKEKNSANLNQEAEENLKKRGYIVGRLLRVIFYEPGVKETNWSATKIIRGIDGKKRRWVYLHYFKEGQPSINWLDPTFSGMRLVIGDALHGIGELGTKALRLDANGFLGVEKVSEDHPAWSEGHPLSEAANHFIASMVRKLGGFTFQELNLTYDDLKVMSKSGADLSYDFVNRPAYHHALITGDTEFLRLSLITAQKYDIDPASLVHALQNHDDLTYELVHYWNVHKDDIILFREKNITGGELRQIIRKELADGITGKVSYNVLFTENGIACTTVSMIAAFLGISNLEKITEQEKAKIIRIHLLLAKFNAWQPGVFALSGWDLVGSLTVPVEKVEPLVRDGDTRWINRGAYDLMDVDPKADTSGAGIPRANSLYASLPDQLKDSDSFVSQLQHILEVRKIYDIAISRQLEIIHPSNKSVLIMLHQLHDDSLQLTVLNFGPDPLTEKIKSTYLLPSYPVIDMLSQKYIGSINDEHTLSVRLGAYEGVSLLIKKP